jgi:nucleoside-diphosphate-sugar epimerase
MAQILITGAGGLMGRVLWAGLSGRYSLSGIDRNAPRGSEIRRANMRRLKSIASAFQGVDAVIDLAADSETTAWRDVWQNNIPATMNALEASRSAGIRRYVFASSNRVTGLYERDLPYSAIVAGEYHDLDPAAIPMIRAGDPPRPDGPYAIGKVLGEAAVSYYAETAGFTAICLRIGSVTAEDRPSSQRHFATLLTHRDLLQLVERALEADDQPPFGVYYGVSANRWRFWDITDARDNLGFVPQDDAESFRTS